MTSPDAGSEQKAPVENLSTDAGSEQKAPDENLSNLSIQDIIKRITGLYDKLAKEIENEESEKKTDSRQQTTAADNQTGTHPQDGSITADIASQEENKDHETNKQDGDAIQDNKDHETHKQDEDAIQENKDHETNKQDRDAIQENKDKANGQHGDVSKEIESTADGRCFPGVCSNKKGKDVGQVPTNNNKDDEVNRKKDVQRELDKLCKELQYMRDSFEKLQKFENQLRVPLKTLEANVEDILKDLPQVKEDELPKQVPLNLRVLRNNITKVKIQIPLQHQTANKSSDANRDLQTTVATTEVQDLPHLYGEKIFEDSYYFKEIEEKYDQLDRRQKLCLFSLVNFPENAEMKKRLLRFWWVGEDLFRDHNPEDELKLVNDIIEVFVQKGLIEPVKKKNKLKARSYKMNPIVRSCLIKFADKEQFFDYDSEGKPTMHFTESKKACMVKSEGSFEDWFSEYLKADPGKVPRLSADLVKMQMLFNFPDRDKLVDARKRFNELQTLFNISKQFPSLPKEWFSKMTELKVLYLGRWETSSTGEKRHIEVEDIDFLRGLENTRKLKLLSLQGISGIPRLPRALRKLENLSLLDLRACHNLEKLPEWIGELKELTYLDLSECYLLDGLPKQLNKLKNLQVLKGFVIGEDKDKHWCTLDDLSALEKLRKLCVNVHNTEFHINKEEVALSKFKGLEKLKIAWGSGAIKKDSTKEDTKPNEGESQKHEQVNSKAKNQQPNGNATKSTTGAKETKGEDKGNQGNSAGEANLKTMNQGEDKKMQNVGTTESAASKVSQQDNQERNTRFGGAAIPVYAVAKFKKLLTGGTKAERKLEGLEKLVKLDLQCFPDPAPPSWLKPEKMRSLKILCIRGGKLGHLSEEGEWKVETLRLKFLLDFKMNWKEMKERFPKLTYLEKVRCPRITFCPCGANGVWKFSE